MSERPRILFVEDEIPFRRFAGMFMEKRGFALDYAGTAAEAYEAFEHRPPDLVLLVLNLPDQHGLQILPRLKTLKADVLVIVLTAYGDVPTAVTALKTGACDYLPMTASPSRVAGQVARLCGRSGDDRPLVPVLDVRAAPTPGEAP